MSQITLEEVANLVVVALMDDLACSTWRNSFPQAHDALMPYLLDMQFSVKRALAGKEVFEIGDRDHTFDMEGT